MVGGRKPSWWLAGLGSICDHQDPIWIAPQSQTLAQRVDLESGGGGGGGGCSVATSMAYASPV